jgi:hypothetical protein
VIGSPVASGGDAAAHDSVAAQFGNETTVGAEITNTSWSTHLSTVYAPFGSVRHDGLRLRAGVGYGEYRYSGYQRINGKLSSASFQGAVTFSDVMLGYQAGFGALTVKGYLGAAFDQHAIAPHDPTFAASGRAIGVKAALETWLDISKVSFAQLDANWTSAHETYSARLRLGYRLTDALSLGIEGGAHGNVESGGGKGGVFARYEWAHGEASLSGGLTGDLERPDAPYASISVLVRY